MNILFIGDVIGRPGRRAVSTLMPELRDRYEVDFCVVNGENAAGGKGINRKVAENLFTSGANVITLGNHTWKNREIFGFIDYEDRLIRPLNFPPSNPGRGWVSQELTSLPRITVVSLAGRVFMDAVDCPFRTMDNFLEEDADRGIILVDFHCEATSEKIAMGRYLDGRVAAVMGTHTHVQTADETILPKGTAYITDAGMTGPHDSIIGCEIDKVMQRFLYNLPATFDVAKKDLKLCGVIMKIDEKTNRALSIERLRIDLPG